MKTFLILILFSSTQLFSQSNISGIVNDRFGFPLENVSVKIIETETTTFTDAVGMFEFETVTSFDEVTLSFSLTGYVNLAKSFFKDDFKDINITLAEDVFRTEEIVVTGSRDGSYIKDSPVKIEVLTERDLNRTFSTDLTRSLEFVGGVKPQNNCGVCYTTDIRIQGLEGQYTQILINGAPVMSNLGTVYGLQGISTSGIKQIEVVKGPGTILFGPEAVAGTINVILKNPVDLPPLSLDFSSTSDAEFTGSLSGSFKLNNVSSSLTMNYSMLDNRIDRNNDNFTDLPLFNRFSLFNQWQIPASDRLLFYLKGKYFYEDRFGGEMNWNRTEHRGGDEVYGESVFTNRQELMTGLNYIINSTLNLEANVSQFYHEQNSVYGEESYMGNQLSVYSDAIVYHDITLRDKMTYGLAFKYERYNDNTPATRNPLTERNIPQNTYTYSAFVQNEKIFSPLLSTQIGLRYNYHNVQRSIWQPRGSIKISPNNMTTFRLSAGTGFRTVNIFTEDHAALTGAREVVILGDLQPEKSINVSAGMIRDFDFDNQFARFTLDGYYTRFSNKIIPDYDTDPNLIIYRNLDGYSVSRGIETSFEYQFSFPVRTKLSYEFLDSFKEEDGLRSEVEFNPKHSLMFESEVLIPSERISFNLFGRWTGKQKMPRFENKDGELTRPLYSPDYMLWDFQAKKKFNNFELYAGVNNIFDFTQESPLIAPEDPFGDEFDTIYVYGPLRGRYFFAGFRFSLF